MQYVVVFTFLFAGFGILTFLLLSRHLIELCDLAKCPFCYGVNLCTNIKNSEISLEFNSFSKIFFNMFSVKNVYFGIYNGQQVVLKKLAHEKHLSNLKLDNSNCSENLIVKYLSSDRNKNFKLCSDTSEKLFHYLHYKNPLNICTILHVSLEPIILEIFSKNENWPVPKLYGYCGRVAVEENTGDPLNSIQYYDWYKRAYVAYQILIAAKNFSVNHGRFRLYLTDISPDNIVVNNNLEVSFVDFGNVILKAKNEKDMVPLTKHYSENFDEGNFIFSEKHICENEISDHNIFAVCKVGHIYNF